MLFDRPSTPPEPTHALTAVNNSIDMGSQSVTAPGRPENPLNVPVRRSKTKEEREAAKGDKAGSPGRFHGQAFLYLSQHIPEYNAIDKTGKGKNTRLGKFWHKIKAGFWQVVSVEEAREGLDKSAVMSDDDVVNNTNEVSSSPTASDSSLTHLLQSIKGFFRWKSKTVGDTLANPWTAVFRDFVSKLNTDESRLRPTWQYYHAKYGPLVTEEYERRGGSSPTDRLKVRNEIARAQFFALSTEEQVALDQENSKVLDEEMDERELRVAQQEDVICAELQAE